MLQADLLGSAEDCIHIMRLANVLRNARFGWSVVPIFQFARKLADTKVRTIVKLVLHTLFEIARSTRR